MNEVFKDIKLWLESNFPKGFESLNPPATDFEIENLEKAIGFPVPSDLIALLKINNGQDRNSPYIFCGEEFMSSSRIIEEFNVWKELHNSGSFDDFIVNPDPQVKSSWWNLKWIPITYDGAGNHVCLDFDPCTENSSGGKEGQVIRMIHDDEDRDFISYSLSEWLSDYLKELKSGKYLSLEDGEVLVHKDYA